MSRLVSTFALLPVLVLFTACGEQQAAQDDSPNTPNVVTEAVAYTHDGVELEGYLAYDANRPGRRPGVLVIHEWWGIDEHPKERARRLAALGYVAFCLDMYGQGKLTDDPEQAKAWATPFYEDAVGYGRKRLEAGYDVLAGNVHVDPARIGAIGFCYGGSVALQLAWSGLPVKGVVCFHGTLMPPEKDDVPNVKSAVLVCNGAADVWVGPEKVKAFEDALAGTAIRHRVVNYEGAVHAFTNPGADERGVDNIGYSEAADEASWQAMKDFLAEHLGSA